MKFKTHKEIDEYYTKEGLDIKKLDKDLNDANNLIKLAINNIKKTKFMNGFFYDPCESFGRFKLEIKLEINRLQKLQEFAISKDDEVNKQ